MARAIPLRERLEMHSIPEPNSGCWLWTATVSGWGNGMIRDGRKMRIAPRVAWEVHRGPIPDGLQVLHRCDVPACVNPDHLFLGTHAVNMADKVAKGRQARHRLACGENNGHAILSETDIAAIRGDQRSHRRIADDYGIGQSHVSRIKSHQRWGHI